MIRGIRDLLKKITVCAHPQCVLIAHVLGQVVKSLSLSHLDYCSPVWSSAPKSILRKLQIAQNRAARLVLHCPMRTNTDSMHHKLSWLPVEKRLALSTATFFSNSIYSTKPEFLYSQITRCRDVHSHFTRTAGDGQIMLPHPKSNALKKTVIYRAITHWNSCPLHIRQSSNKSTFKYHLRIHYLNS